MTPQELKTTKEKFWDEHKSLPNGKITNLWIKYLISLVLASDQREREAFEAGRKGKAMYSEDGSFKVMVQTYPNFEIYKSTRDNSQGKEEK